MSIGDLPEDMKDMISVASDHTATQEDGLDAEAFEASLRSITSDFQIYVPCCKDSVNNHSASSLTQAASSLESSFFSQSPSKKSPNYQKGSVTSSRSQNSFPKFSIENLQAWENSTPSLHAERSPLGIICEEFNQVALSFSQPGQREITLSSAQPQREITLESHNQLPREIPISPYDKSPPKRRARVLSPSRVSSQPALCLDIEARREMPATISPETMTSQSMFPETMQMPDIHSMFPETKISQMPDLQSMFPETKASQMPDMHSMFPETKTSQMPDLQSMFPETKTWQMPDMHSIFPETKTSQMPDLQSMFPETKTSQMPNMHSIFPETKTSQMPDLQSMFSETKTSQMPDMHSIFPETKTSQMPNMIPDMQSFFPETAASDNRDERPAGRIRAIFRSRRRLHFLGKSSVC
jgi:hypothetical protein